MEGKLFCVLAPVFMGATYSIVEWAPFDHINKNTRSYEEDTC